MKEVDLKIMQPSKPKELNLKLYGTIMCVCEIIEKQTSKETSTTTASWLCAEHNFLPDYRKYKRLTTSDVEETVLSKFLRRTHMHTSSHSALMQTFRNQNQFSLDELAVFT